MQPRLSSNLLSFSLPSTGIMGMCHHAQLLKLFSLKPSISIILGGGVQDWGLKSGLHTCKAGILLLERTFSIFYSGHFWDGFGFFLFFGFLFLVILEFELRASCLLGRLYHLSHGDGVSWICPCWPWTTILQISASQEATIIDISHQYLAYF
jgi:hypothetical protein